MEDIYYFSQGRLIHNVPYKKFVDTNVMVMKDTTDIKEVKNVKEVNEKNNNIFNFKVFNASILRYK
jgi:hypothetical protein